MAVLAFGLSDNPCPSLKAASLPLDDTRDEFPILERVNYLNTASIGLVPKTVASQVAEFEQELALGGTVGFDEETELRCLESAREAGAQLLGAEPGNIAIVSSFTEALCQVAWWLRPGPGTNVVSTDVDFPSVTYPWFRLAEETGCDVRLVPVLSDPVGFDLEALARYVDSETRVISISHVQYLTGHRLDLEALADLAHNHGALVVLDATQSAGQVPIDVSSVDIDVVISGSYKWLCSTFGAAVCYLAPSVVDRFNPPFVGWRSTVEPYELDAHFQPLARSARKMEYSTMSYASAFALGLSVRYMLDLGQAPVLEHNAALADRLIAGLDERGATVLTPRQPERRAGIVTARFEGRDGEEVAQQLNKRGVIVSPRVGSTRFSLHHYNNEADVDGALYKLDEILSR
jgi:selenocysteine lyase/cysteine desulfurase